MKKILNIIFPLVAVVLGVIVIVIGVKQFGSKDLYDSQAKAVITAIDREWTGTDGDGFDTYDYHVYVDYEIDGQKYEHVEYPSYSSSMKQGDEIDIIYQSSDPSKINEPNMGRTAIIFIAVGAVVSLGGLFMSIKALLRK